MLSDVILPSIWLICLAILKTSAETNISRRADDSSSICSGGLPDGTALLADGDKEVLAVFEGDHFWLTCADDLVTFVKNSSRMTLFNDENRMTVSKFFEPFRDDSDYIVSFSGLNPAEKLHNNLLIFKGDSCMRFQVKFRGATIKASLEDIYDVSRWVLDKPRNKLDFEYMVLLRGAKLLLVRERDTRFYKTYALNEENIYLPPVYNTELLKQFKESMRFYHELRTKDSLSFLNNGQICLNDICKLFKTAFNCDNDDQEKLFTCLRPESGLSSTKIFLIAILLILLISGALAYFVYNKTRNHQAL